MFARFLIISVCIGFSLRFLLGFFFDHYGLVSLGMTLQYEQSLKENLQKLTEVQSSYQMKAGRGVEPGDIALASGDDLLVRVENRPLRSNHTHLIGALYEFPAEHRDNRGILRIAGGVAGTLSYMAMLYWVWRVRSRNRKKRPTSLYSVSGRASR